MTFTLTLKFIKSVSPKIKKVFFKLTINILSKTYKKISGVKFLFSHNIHFHIGSHADFWKIEPLLVITTFNLDYEYILNCQNCI